MKRLYLLDPTRVVPLVSPDGSVFYQLMADNLAGIKEVRAAVPASEIIHDRMNCLFHPLVGTSPIYACGTAASMGLKIERNQTSFFAQGSNPSGILTKPLEIPPDKAKELAMIWNSQFGDGQGGVAVLGGGMQFTPMRMSAVDSQLIEQLKWTAEVVCSTFHVPAWKVGVGQQPAYTKPEIADQAYYSNCLQSLIEQFELCMDEGLGLDEPKEGKTYGVELDLDGLLRMDAASQVTTLKEAVSGSLMRIDEARKKLDLKPIPGGGSIWMQQQNYSLEALAERDRNDPFAKPEPPPPPEPTPAAPAGEDQKLLPAPENESLEMWDGWFARDSLAIVREAKELEIRVVEDAIRADSIDATHELLVSLGASVAVLASREQPATVVNVAPAEVRIEPQALQVTIEARPGTRTGRIVRDAKGNATVEITERDSDN